MWSDSHNYNISKLNNINRAWADCDQRTKGGSAAESEVKCWKWSAKLKLEKKAWNLEVKYWRRSAKLKFESEILKAKCEIENFESEIRNIGTGTSSEVQLLHFVCWWPTEWWGEVAILNRHGPLPVAQSSEDCYANSVLLSHGEKSEADDKAPRLRFIMLRRSSGNKMGVVFV